MRTPSPPSSRSATAEDYEDAIVRFARSTDLVATLRRDWQALGCPVLAPGGAGQPRPHPLPRRDSRRGGAFGRAGLRVAARSDEPCQGGTGARRSSGRKLAGAGSAGAGAAPARRREVVSNLDDLKRRIA